MIAATRSNGSARFSMKSLLEMLQYSAPETMGSRFRAAFLFALALGVAAAAAPSGQEPAPLAVVLDRAGWYLDYFVDEFENVVAEENYVQDSALLLPSFMPVVAGGGRAGPPMAPLASAADTARARHRDLLSDLLVVKSPDTVALVPFCDVLTVDGVPVRDREARLARLFLNSSSSFMEQ